MTIPQIIKEKYGDAARDVRLIRRSKDEVADSARERKDS